MNRVRITETLLIDCGSERWLCQRCGTDLGAARGNYKESCLLHERSLEEVHPPMTGEGAYTFTPNPEYCRLIEFYCPGCGVIIETEYLPPGHPITHDIEIDIDALKQRARANTTV